MQRVTRIGAWCGTFAAIATAGGLVYTGYNSAPVPTSVKEFHTEAMEPMQVQMNRTEGKITAVTIPPLLGIVCNNPTNMNMRELLLERVHEYELLLGREYTLPDLDTCGNNTGTQE